MSNIQTIPLAKLKPDKAGNVRKTGGKNIEELAASIRANGLLQNLGVVPSGKGYGVVFGGRRLRALQLLQKEGALPESLAAGIPCRVLSEGEAQETSLAENTIREAMHPLDQFQAFQALVEEGKDIAEVAASFGVTELFVRQRMRLARVSPKLLRIYGAGEMTLEQLQAFAVIDDHERQEAHWQQVRHSPYGADPARIRSALARTEVGKQDHRVEFVGLEAYQAAGGQLRRDLFSEEVFILDVPLLERLVAERLEACAEVLRADGWAWVEIGDSPNFATTTRLEGDFSESTDEELAELEALDARMEAGEILPPEDLVRFVMLEEALFTPEQKAASGVRIGVGSFGRLDAWPGLLREGEAPPPAPEQGVEDQEEGEGDTRTDNRTVQVGTHERALKKPGDLSFKAVQQLQAEANAIVQGQVAEAPYIALALLVAQLAADSDRLYPMSARYNLPRQWVRIGREAAGRMPGPLAEITAESPVGKPMRAQAERWRKLLPATPKELPAWALEQQHSQLLRLLAFLVAAEIDAVDLFPTASGGVVDLAATAGLDLAASPDLESGWRPTEEWLASLPKAAILALVEDAAGQKAVPPLAKLSKGELPARALPLLPAGWLPPTLRGAAQEDPNPKPQRARGKAAAAGDAA